MRARLAMVAAGGAAFLTAAAPADAHGFFLTPSLPIPPWLFGAAAAFVVAVSFVALGALWSEPVLDDRRWRAFAPRVGALLTSLPAQILFGLVGLGVLLLVVYAGLHGEQTPDDNFATAFVFASFWVGLAVLSALFGDVFAPLNPWRTAGRVIRSAGRRYVGDSTMKLAPFTYPERLGVAPAALGLLGFGYLELVSARTPHDVAVAALVYTGVTFVGMALFGTETWAKRGEAFGVYFGLLSKLSPLEIRDRRLGLRRPLSGLRTMPPTPGTVLLLSVLIGVVSYDGGGGSAPFQRVLKHLIDFYTNVGFGLVDANRLAATTEMLLCVALVFAFFMAGILATRALAGGPPAIPLARIFVVSLVPIALAYTIAHYLGFLLYAAQFLIPLASNPLGHGADYLGTAGYEPNLAPLSAQTLWYFEVGSIIAGHVLGLAIAHDIALEHYRERGKATRSQLGMLAVMIGFTVFALWLLKEASEL